MIASMEIAGTRTGAQRGLDVSVALCSSCAWDAGDVRTSDTFLMASREAGSDAVSDHALIHACLKHDKNAFAQLIQRYESSVASVLWRFTRDRVMLEELVQDTFVEAYFSLRRFRADAPFFPWLRTIATRVGYRSWRRARRDRLRHMRYMQWSVPSASTSAGHEPTDTAEYVYGLLEALDPKDRLVLTLQYFEGCSTSEIADRMGWSATLVKVRAFRARKRLKALLLEMESPQHEHP